MGFNDTCLVRSTTSSLHFDIAFATLSANIDEELRIRSNIDNADTTAPILPDKPSWWFYNFRIYSQLIILLFNVAKMIYALVKNDTDNAILSAVRSICVLGIIARHYYLCNYKFVDLAHGKLTPHLVPLQYLFMTTYATVGAISAGIDPYFASDSHNVILFFLVPITFRALSFATASLWSKLMMAMKAAVVDDAAVVIVVPTVPALIIFFFYGAVFFLSLAGSNTTSIFFTDRLLCGLLFVVPFASSVRNILKREQKRTKVYIELRESPMISANVSACEDGNSSEIEDGQTNNRQSDVFDALVHDHKLNILELRKQLNENEIFALITPVACTFMIIMVFELAMSMYLYRRDGVPTNWCPPFMFHSIDKGFQYILDYFL